MNRSRFVELVLEFLGAEVLEWEIYNNGTEVIMNLKDANLEIEGEEWYSALQHYLNSHGYKVRITFGDGNWTTIHKHEEITRDDDIMKVTVKWTGNGECYFVREMKTFDKSVREIRKGDNWYNILKSSYERSNSSKSVEDDGLTYTERFKKFLHENPNAFRNNEHKWGS